MNEDSSIRLPRPPRRRASWAVVAGLCLAAAAPARAQSPERLVERGLDLMEAGSYEDALGLFRQAYDRAPTPRTRAQIGLAEQALERWLDAEPHLAEALATRSDPWIEKRRRVLEEALASVRTRLGLLVVEGTPAGAEVLLDGEVVGVLPFRQPLRVVAGARQLGVRAPGFFGETRSLDIASTGLVRQRFVLSPRPIVTPIGWSGQKARAPVAASPIVVPARPDVPAPAALGWRRTLGAVSVAGGGAGVALGAMMLWLDGRCSGHGREGCVDVYDTRTRGLLALGAGGALLASGAWLIWQGGARELAFSFRPSGVLMAGRF